MDDKKNLYIAGAAILVVILAVFLFWRTDVSDNRGTVNSLGEQLDDIGTKQQQATDALGRVSDGLTDSIESVGRIEQSGMDAEESVDGIAATNSGIKEAVTNAAAGNDECQVLLSDSEQRINESRVILQTVRSAPTKDRTAP